MTDQSVEPIRILGVAPGTRVTTEPPAVRCTACPSSSVAHHLASGRTRFRWHRTTRSRRRQCIGPASAASAGTGSSSTATTVEDVRDYHGKTLAPALSNGSTMPKSSTASANGRQPSRRRPNRRAMRPTCATSPTTSGSSRSRPCNPPKSSDECSCIRKTADDHRHRRRHRRQRRRRDGLCLRHGENGAQRPLRRSVGQRAEGRILARRARPR